MLGSVLALVSQILDLAGAIAKSGGDAESALRTALAAMVARRAEVDAVHDRTDDALDALPHSRLEPPPLRYEPEEP